MFNGTKIDIVYCIYILPLSSKLDSKDVNFLIATHYTSFRPSVEELSKSSLRI